MNALWELLNHPLTHRVGWALLHSLWQGALAAALFGLLRATMRRRSANARYLTGCAILFLLAAAPLLTFLHGPPTAFGSMGSQVTEIRAGVGSIVASGPASGRSIGFGSSASGLLTKSLEAVERLVPWLVAAWAIGVLVFS